MTQPSEEVLDNPTPWVAKHIRTYVESGGREGHNTSVPARCC